MVLEMLDVILNHFQCFSSIESSSSPSVSSIDSADNRLDIRKLLRLSDSIQKERKKVTYVFFRI